MGKTLASYTVSFLQMLHETFNILQILFIMIIHQGSVWMSILLYSSLAQKAFKIGSAQLQALFHQIAAKLLMLHHCQKPPTMEVWCQVEIWSSPRTRKEAKTVVVFWVVTVQNMTQVVNALSTSLHKAICTTLLWLRKRLSLTLNTCLYICACIAYRHLYMHIYLYLCTYIYICSSMRYTCRITHKEIQSESRFLWC